MPNTPSTANAKTIAATQKHSHRMPTPPRNNVHRCNASTTQKDACFPAKKLYRRGERKHYLFLGKLEKSGETKKGWHCSNATPFPQVDAG